MKVTDNEIEKLIDRKIEEHKDDMADKIDKWLEDVKAYIRAIYGWKPNEEEAKPLQ